MSTNHIPFNRPYFIGKELLYIEEAVTKNRRLSGAGEFTKRCAAWLTQHLGVHKSIITHSCTAALEMAAILTDLGPGDEVIMPSFTFSSTANAVVLRGATPVFVDIRPDTLNINENLIERAITKKTKGIWPIHYAGYPANMSAIMSIARAHNIPVVEDAAQALLSQHDGRYMGTVGDFGCLSFHETKNVIAGEGGALLINNPTYAHRAEIIWEKGTNRVDMLRGLVDKYTWLDMGSSYAPSELISAFLLAQLEHAESIIANRRASHALYQQKLAHLQNMIILPKADSATAGNGHIFYILLRTAAEREEMRHALTAQSINAIIHYIPLHSAPAGLKFCRTDGGTLPITDDLSARLLRLPLYYGMQESEIDSVVQAIENFYVKRKSA